MLERKRHGYTEEQEESEDMKSNFWPSGHIREVRGQSSPRDWAAGEQAPQDPERRETEEVREKNQMIIQQQVIGGNLSSTQHQKCLAGLRQGPRKLGKENVWEALRKRPSQRLSRKARLAAEVDTVKGARWKMITEPGVQGQRRPGYAWPQAESLCYSLYAPSISLRGIHLVLESGAGSNW